MTDKSRVGACPYCKRSLSWEPHLAGHTVRCPYCRHDFQIASSPDVPPSPPLPPTLPNTDSGGPEDAGERGLDFLDNSFPSRQLSPPYNRSLPSKWFFGGMAAVFLLLLTMLAAMFSENASDFLWQCVGGCGALCGMLGVIGVAFLPTIIAVWEKHPHRGGIIVMNACFVLPGLVRSFFVTFTGEPVGFLGWLAFLAWVVALAWTFMIPEGGNCWRCNARLNGFPPVCQFCQADLAWVKGRSRPT
jgi:hypothetical protein